MTDLITKNKDRSEIKSSVGVVVVVCLIITFFPKQHGFSTNALRRLSKNHLTFFPDDAEVFKHQQHLVMCLGCSQEKWKLIIGGGGEG